MSKLSDWNTQECCDRPSILSHDYRKEGSIIVNRGCQKCGKHWWGPVENVQEFTRSQWDAFLLESMQPAAA